MGRMVGNLSEATTSTGVYGATAPAVQRTQQLASEPLALALTTLCRAACFGRLAPRQSSKPPHRAQ